MSARMMKKVLKEQEAALQQQQQQLNSDDGSESSDSPTPARNYFDLLEDEDNHSCDDQLEKDEIAIESSDCAIAKKHSFMETDANTVRMSNVKSKKKKKNKKKKLGAISESDVRSSDLMLESLSLGASSSGHQLGAPNDIMLKKHCNYSVLQVDPKFLSAENELRRIFGNSVVKTHERSNLPVHSSRLVRGGRRVSHNLKKTILVSPSQHWPRWDGSLSMELLETRDGVHYFR
ncbi:hypothetical protein PHJA_000062900 [Phtheirospermum japonicum]|uniref:Uncharacterized protein n=1 Tax=Phtheirospermum japonicum TaxID=374723 RepID=A0A830B3Z9_9LAMI|nr:hypothetical protein PHJA_000062900 [Phtheirospermum japonicum]